MEASNPPRPLLSICIAVGPGESAGALIATLSSVSQQTERDAEVVIKTAGNQLVDEILKYQSEDPGNRPDILLLRGQDSGIYDAYNQCALSARGRYIIFMGCGDMLAQSDVISKLAARVSANHEADEVIYGGVILRDVSKNTKFDNDCFFGRRARLPWRNPCHSQGLIYQKEWFDSRPFRIDIGPLADLVHTHQYRVYERAAWLDHPVSIFLVGGASTRLHLRALRARLRGVSANCDAFSYSWFWRPVSCAVFIAGFIMAWVKSLNSVIR